MPEKLEYKFMEGLKALDTESDGKMRFSGYLAYFDNVDSYGDVIEKGAFRNTLRELRRKGRTTPVLEQHGGGWFGPSTDNTPIGYYESLKEDDNGLFAEGILFSTERGKSMHTLLKEAPAGAMGQSIGYSVVKSRFPEKNETRKTGVMRYLEEVKLWEGSIVTFPANDKARVDDVKTASLFWRQMEEHFRKNGFSKENAKKAVALVKSCTPEASFGLYLAQCGFVPQDDGEAKLDDGVEFEGAKKLVAALNEAKMKREIERFKSAFKI